jgi:hypothetical protein
MRTEAVLLNCSTELIGCKAKFGSSQFASYLRRDRRHFGIGIIDSTANPQKIPGIRCGEELMEESNRIKIFKTKKPVITDGLTVNLTLYAKRCRIFSP